MAVFAVLRHDALRVNHAVVNEVFQVVGERSDDQPGWEEMQSGSAANAAAVFGFLQGLLFSFVFRPPLRKGFVAGLRLEPGAKRVELSR